MKTNLWARLASLVRPEVALGDLKPMDRAIALLTSRYEVGWRSLVASARARQRGSTNAPILMGDGGRNIGENTETGVHLT